MTTPPLPARSRDLPATCPGCGSTRLVKHCAKSSTCVWLKCKGCLHVLGIVGGILVWDRLIMRPGGSS